jgi:hypothetical protein
MEYFEKPFQLSRFSDQDYTLFNGMREGDQRQNGRATQREAGPGAELRSVTGAGQVSFLVDPEATAQVGALQRQDFYFIPLPHNAQVIMDRQSPGNIIQGDSGHNQPLLPIMPSDHRMPQPRQGKDH